jgi:hypothetical protein|tara:strand:+ start:3582 stop:3788 length:207 start_codon:yes stop_codon:yes gene_type:complete
MKIGDLVMKRDGHIKSSPHYKRLGIIIEKNQRITSDGVHDSPVVRVRWAGDYGTFWTNENSLSLVSET